ncbi:kinase-like domain-containing protein [Dichotomocladium elegans]|nr:kinase-like domain-containing protein [Dichotomocladium elegans]
MPHNKENLPNENDAKPGAETACIQPAITETKGSKAFAAAGHRGTFENNKRKWGDNQAAGNVPAVDGDEEKNNSDQLRGYQKLSKIGEGSYGVVFKARQKLTNKMVALKKLRLHDAGGVPVTALREIAILKELKHRNINGLKDLIHAHASVYLVTELQEMDLGSYIQKAGRDGLTADHIRSFMHQILSGIYYCHTRRVLHRDMKPQNILIDQRGKLTITDMGLSRAFSIPMRTYTHSVITLWYRPPEILLGARYYSTAVDMWSIGCIFAEMIIMRPLFPGDSQIDELFRIFKFLGTPNNRVWPGVTDLADFSPTFPNWKAKGVRSLLQKTPQSLELDDDAFDILEKLLLYDPSDRMSAKKALEHPYFYKDTTKLRL